MLCQQAAFLPVSLCLVSLGVFASEPPVWTFMAWACALAGVMSAPADQHTCIPNSTTAPEAV